MEVAPGNNSFRARPIPTGNTALLLVGHGTKSPTGIAQFLALSERLAARLAPLPVEPAFLELAQPDIDTAVARLLEHNVTRLVTLPLLLFAAGHAKDDIPRAVTTALARSHKPEAQATPHKPEAQARGSAAVKRKIPIDPLSVRPVQCLQAPHLGCHPALVQLSALRVGWAVPTTSRDDVLLLVGRGSRDPSATAEMHEFARLRSVGWASPTSASSQLKIEVAFLAMARPLLSEQLANLACRRVSRVIVQPHLLFHGDLVDSVNRQVNQMRSAYPGIQWLVTEPLADPPGQATLAAEIIEQVVVDRAAEAGIHVVATAAEH